MGYYEGDISGITGNNNGFAGDQGWWVIILFALIFGWGGNGFGRGGNQGGGAMDNYVLASDFATIQRQLSDGFGDLTSQSRYIQNGICDGFYAMNTSLLNGFNGVNSAIANCCCTTQRSIDQTNYNMAKNTCDIIQAGNANTQRIIDYLSTKEMAQLQAENASLKGQISQNAQTATILNAVNRTPTPAYVVPNPYCCNTYGCNGTSIQ